MFGHALDIPAARPAADTEPRRVGTSPRRYDLDTRTRWGGSSLGRLCVCAQGRAFQPVGVVSGSPRLDAFGIRSTAVGRKLEDL